MKNTTNLYNAMKTVENACEPNEITIIGHGATPTALELLGKCVRYIDKMYNTDVLKEWLALTEQKPCTCPCHDDDDEDEEWLCEGCGMPLDECECEPCMHYDRVRVRGCLNANLAISYPYLTDDAREKIIDIALSVYDDAIGTPESEYERYDFSIQIENRLAEDLPDCLAEEIAESVCVDIENYIDWE